MEEKAKKVVTTDARVMVRPKENPPSTKVVYFYTKTDDPDIENFHKGFFVKDINKHVTNVNRWKDMHTDIWYDDDQVTYWFYPYS